MGHKNMKGEGGGDLACSSHQVAWRICNYVKSTLKLLAWK